MNRACKNIYTQADDYQCEHHVTKINNYKHMKIILQITLILIFTTQIYSQDKILKLHSNNGTARAFTLTEIDSITFSVNAAPCPGITTLTYSGKTYNTVQIGTQCWLKENLDVGTMITYEINSSQGQNQTNNNIIEKYCYTDDADLCNIYGGLYQWDEAMQYSTSAGAQGICPSGWHIPTTAEFTTLSTYVNRHTESVVDGREELNYTPPLTQNETGFSALFAGYLRDGRIAYHKIRLETFFWDSNGQVPALRHDISAIVAGNGNKNYGYSVRCLKN